MHTHTPTNPRETLETLQDPGNPGTPPPPHEHRYGQGATRCDATLPPAPVRRYVYAINLNQNYYRTRLHLSNRLLTTALISPNTLIQGYWMTTKTRQCDSTWNSERNNTKKFWFCNIMKKWHEKTTILGHSISQFWSHSFNFRIKITSFGYHSVQNCIQNVAVKSFDAFVIRWFGYSGIFFSVGNNVA